MPIGRSAASATGRSSVSTRRCRCRTARCWCRTARASSRSSDCSSATPDPASVLGRTAELLVQRIRGRANGVGAALQLVKRGVGRAAGALDVRRANVGDIGFNLDEVDLAMSALSQRLLTRFDYAAIRRRRVENYRRLAERLGRRCHAGLRRRARRRVPAVLSGARPGQTEAAERLRARGVDALEFWNDSCEPGGHEMGPGRAGSCAVTCWNCRSIRT